MAVPWADEKWRPCRMSRPYTRKSSGEEMHDYSRNVGYSSASKNNAGVTAVQAATVLWINLGGSKLLWARLLWA